VAIAPVAVAPEVVAAPVAQPVAAPVTAVEPRAKPTRPPKAGKPIKQAIAAAATRPEPAPTPEPARAPPEVLIVKAPTAEPAKPESGTVDFRVRPYASVFINGMFYGITPFPVVKLNVGVHTVKLVNKDLGKEVTLQYEVKPGDNTLKYNLDPG